MPRDRNRWDRRDRKRRKRQHGMRISGRNLWTSLNEKQAKLERERKEQVMLCDNSSNRGNYIMSPSCWGQEATQSVTIEYNSAEKDYLFLCDKCAKVVTRDARRRGYKVTNVTRVR